MLTTLALAMAAALTAPQKEAIKTEIGKNLRDPFSAQYEWPAVRSETTYCGWVNAKNGFGAYGGYQPFLVLYYINLKTKALVVVNSEMDQSIVVPMCAKDGYAMSR